MILPLVLGLAFAVAVLTPVVARFVGRDAGWFAAAALAALAVYTWVGVPVDEMFSWSWIPDLGVDFALHMDSLGRLFGMIVLGVGAVVMAYSTRYLSRSASHAGYYGLMTMFAASMLGLVWADDVILLFVMWEFTTLCSFFLISIAGSKGTAPAVRTLLVTVAGGLCLLAAVAYMVVATGTTRLSEILVADIWAEDTTFTVTIAVLVALAAFTKSAQFPFHSWLPDAMVAATPVSAYLHAAAMVKAGIYLLLRFSEPLHAVGVWQVLLIGSGLITAVVGAVFALQRHDIKELLAYSTISQLGFLVATIGIGTPAAMVAAVAHTVAHALFKASLFMFVGVIDHQTGTRDMRKLPPLYRIMPGSTVAIALAAASMAGLPPLLGFVSKEQLFKTMLDAPGADWTGPAVGAIAVFAAIFTFAYSARFLLGGTVSDGCPASDEPAASSAGARARIHAPVRAFLLPAALPAYVGLLFGLAGFLIEPVVGGAAAASIGESYETDLGLWHGPAPELFMSMVVIAVGIALVVWRRPVERALARDLVPISGVAVVEGIRSGIIRTGTRIGNLTRDDGPARHVALVLLGIVGIAVVAVFSLDDLPEQVGDPARAHDWLVVALVAIGTVALVLVRNRVAAVALVGIVGFSVALWFFLLGAVDVALTQMLVEVLTVVVLVLVLQRMPRRFPPVRASRRAVTAVIAIAVGLASGAAVWAFTGRRELSDVGRYFMENAEADTGGVNVVNTILVDYRALDTLGELTVLGVCGIAIVVALRGRDPLGRKTVDLTVPPTSMLIAPFDNNVFLRSFTRIAAPIIVAISLFYLVRGHGDPGGGFNSALIAGAGIALYYLRASNDETARIRLPYVSVIAAGVSLGVLTGLVGYFDGSFLLPLHAYLGDLHLTTALVFDVGVYLAVLGVVMAAVDRLGGDRSNGGAGDEPSGGDRRSPDPPSGSRSAPAEEVNS